MKCYKILRAVLQLEFPGELWVWQKYSVLSFGYAFGFTLFASMQILGHMLWIKSQINSRHGAAYSLRCNIQSRHGANSYKISSLLIKVSAKFAIALPHRFLSCREVYCIVSCRVTCVCPSARKLPSSHWFVQQNNFILRGPTLEKLLSQWLNCIFSFKLWKRKLKF